ncbi:uncharacterized protein [Chelonus insularis]|uniref:uncharacterized protein n=1 Tax=Chelonus insularis TaxID=460826 RepID=UPI001588ADF6|nr:uncharacterized protein LOC118064301 [Chelonus insularis]
MGPSMAVELVVHNNILKETQVMVGTLVGDDDSSTISAVRRASSIPIEKCSDMNHATKFLSNALYSMKLPSNIIKYFKRCFSYAHNSSRHGDHDSCGKWCRYHEEKENFRHHGLPNGEPLDNLIMKEKLTKVFNRYASNAIKLAPCASTQKNEAFNSVVTSKHPKSRFYGASESFITCVHSAVCQMNRGTSYVVKLNEKLSLSPGKNTIKFRAEKDKERLKHKKVSETPKFKNRRLFRKKERSQ